MLSLSTPLKPLSLFPPFVRQHNPSNNNALSTNTTNYFLSKRGGSVAHRQHMFVAVHGAPDEVESSRKIPLSEVVVLRKKREFWERSWTSWDVVKLVIFSGLHVLSLLAPFYSNWAAFRVFLWLVPIHGICITLSYHRNLTHRSFDLPKWLEYLFAYGGLLAFEVWLLYIYSQETIV